MKQASFEFPNQLTPKHIHTIYLQLGFDEWYSSSDVIDLLRHSQGDIQGKQIVQKNIESWILLGLGETRPENWKVNFKLSNLGKYLQETFSTNQELFFDVIHYLFYSTWFRTNNLRHGRFWLYSRVCDHLWENAPSLMDSYGITSIVQQEAQEKFPELNPKFAERSVRAVFPWLGSLAPAFLNKANIQSKLVSKRRDYCTPQLFHLATDLLYSKKQLRYGTSMAVSETEITDICKTCLLDTDQFWEMADRTKMIMRGFDIRKGQFSTSIALETKPNWIELPDYSNLGVNTLLDEYGEDKDE